MATISDTSEAIGLQLDAAKQAAAALKAPGALQAKANPALMDAYTAQLAQHQQNIAALQGQYEAALGPVPAARPAVSSTGRFGVAGGPLPIMATPGVVPAVSTGFGAAPLGNEANRAGGTMTAPAAYPLGNEANRAGPVVTPDLQEMGRGTVSTLSGFGAMPRYQPTTAAGSFFQAGQGIKNITGNEALKVSKTKLMLDMLLKGPEAAKNTAQAAEVSTRVTQAEQARQRGASPAEIAAIVTGRPAPTDTNVFLPTVNPNQVDVGNRHTGAIQRVTPQPRMTEAEVISSMARNKKTRAEVIQKAREQGIGTP